MKTSFVLLAIAALLSCGGGSSSSITQPTYTPASPGTAVGSPVTAKLDSAGGTIASDDGRLEVTIPAGVLSAATQVSVQTLTNTSPNGVGGAYRLSPEGTTFSQPVTLIFHLSDVENVGIDSTYVVTQHTDGLWYSQPNQMRDSTAKTVSVNATHFSDWAIAETALLTPAKARVRTNTATSFVATILVVHEDSDELANPVGEELALPMPAPLTNQINGTKIWSVNGIEGGNTTIGLVRDPGSFTAPNQEPTPNAVTVSVTIQLGTAKVIAPAEADIYQGESWTGTTDVTQTDGSKIHADVTFIQKMEASNSMLNLHFIIQTGVVRFTPAATTGAGCPQSVTPDMQMIGPNDGTLSITYDSASGPEDGKAIGAGTTAWNGTYTFQCPNGNQVVDSTVVAAWWPVDYSNPTGGLTALNGVLDGTITNALATATIHFVRE